MCALDNYLLSDNFLQSFYGKVTYYTFLFQYSRRSFELTRKDRLYKNIEKLQLAKGAKHFDFIPQTFVMPQDYRELCTMHHRNRGPWIVKPVASSRGRGIYIINNVSTLLLFQYLNFISRPLIVNIKTEINYLRKYKTRKQSQQYSTLWIIVFNIAILA